MRYCSICRIGKQLHEFESVRSNCWRNECRECRRVQRKQRTRTGLATNANANDDDTVSMMSGGADTQATDGDYGVSVRDQEERMRDSLRPLEEQLRALTDEHRKGSMPSIGQRLVQLEHEMQSLRGAMAACECSGRDSGPALAPFRVAGMYDAHVCAVAVGGGAILVEAENMHRRVTRCCTCFTRDMPPHSMLLQ
jgi:hypothetical protein